MPRPFAITTAKDTVSLGNDGTGQATFTVSNTFEQAALGRGKVVPAEPAQEDWYQIADDIERTLRPDQTTEYTVRVKVPDGTPTGDYSMRFDMVLLDNRDEVAVEGPSVTVKHKAEVPEPNGKRFPWWILGVAAAVLLIIGGVLWFVLRPKMTTVPDVSTTDLLLAEATTQLEAKNLVAVVGDGVSDVNKPVDTVIAQDPAPDTKVKKDSTVTLTVISDMETVPDVGNLFLDAAQSKLTEVGFASTVSYEVRQGVPAKIVLGQTPAALEMAPRNSQVALVVSNDAVNVPDIVGKKLDGAVAASLARAGLYVTFTSKGVNDLASHGTIASADPTDKVLVAKGTTVKLVINRINRIKPDVFDAKVKELLEEHGLIRKSNFIRADAILKRRIQPNQ